MKKINHLFLSLFIIIGMTSCDSKKDPSTSYTFQGTQIIDDMSYNIEFTYDINNLVNFDNTAYNKQLSVLLSVLSADIYTTTKTTISSHEDENIYDLLNLDYKTVTMSSSDYETDSDDISNYTLAKQKIVYQDETYNFLFVVIQGSNEEASCWKSNFDVGADSENYYAMTGEHPEWDDTSCHKGFYVTSKRIEKEINDYIQDDNENLTIFFTGHSRGGAIANLLGKDYEKNTDYKTTTYTFASPNTVDNTTIQCDTIFNVINEDDLIPTMPPTFWGMQRYGKDITIDMNNYSSEYHDMFALPYIGCHPESIDEYFKELALTREDFYNDIEGSKGESYYDYYFIESNEASGRKKLEQQLSDEGLLQYTKIYFIDKGIMDLLCLRLTPAFMVNFIINAAFSEDPTSYIADRVTYLNTDYYKSFISFYDDINTKGIYEAHVASTYYLMANLID